MNWNWFVPLAITWCALTEMFARWYHSRDLDYNEGELWAPYWIQWGTCLSGNRRYAHDFRYFVLRLPSYDWLIDGSRIDQRGAWHQCALLRFNGKWRLTYFEPLSP